MNKKVVVGNAYCMCHSRKAWRVGSDIVVWMPVPLCTGSDTTECVLDPASDLLYKYDAFLRAVEGKLTLEEKCAVLREYGETFRTFRGSNYVGQSDIIGRTVIAGDTVACGFGKFIVTA